MPSRMMEETLSLALDVAGAAPADATGGSMHPFIRAGARLWIERCAPDAVRRGDVIAFRHQGCVVLHRVTSEDAHPISVRGDAQSDAVTIEPHCIVGRVQGIALGHRQWRGAPRPLVELSGRAVLAVAPLWLAARRSRWARLTRRGVRGARWLASRAM